MLRNRRGATSLRWLRALLDHEVVVHGQVVVCPGVNDGPVLADTLAGVLDRYPELASVACVPLGVSRFNTEAAMRPHTVAEARAVVDLVESWQTTFLAGLGRRVVYPSDEYYLMSGRPFPELASYGELAQHENGVGMVRAFEAAFCGRTPAADSGPSGFFRSVDGAPAEGYRATRLAGSVSLLTRRNLPVTVLTGTYAATVLGPMLAGVAPDVEVRPVDNAFFGGNIGVAGLLTGADVASALNERGPDRRYLLPDVCLSGGRFLDGLSLDELPFPVEVVAADGASLRQALLTGSAR